MKISGILVVTIAVSFPAFTAGSEFYQHVDKNGRVTFNRVPDGGTIPEGGQRLIRDVDGPRLSFQPPYVPPHKTSQKKKMLSKQEQLEKTKKEDEARLEREKKEEQARLERQKIRNDLHVASSRARFPCQGKFKCEKYFSLTQIYISENSDMRIQLATDTIIETHNPSKLFYVGLKATKTPGKLDNAEIRLSATCKDSDNDDYRDACNKKLILIYNNYPKFMQKALQ